MPKQLYFVTTNDHKFREISAVLQTFGIKLKQKRIELVEPGHETVEEVAVAKARHAFAVLRKPLIVEDTGFFFDAYKNFPGVYSKRVWLGIGFEGLLKLVEGKSRRARFKVAIAYIEPFKKRLAKKGLRQKPRHIKVFKGELKGKVLQNVKRRRVNRLPYEKIFVPDGHKKTIVQMSLKEKNAISHRGIAARKLGKWLKTNRSA